ncbi:MAG TPA: FMN-binding protein [Clostridia bacterium]|nr:FMN-binding protein [Clostridia bacterium]
MKRKKIIILSILIVLIGFIIAIIGTKAYIEAKLERLADQSISNVDLSNAKDGIYIGSYKAFPVAAEVEVTINNHRIKEIGLKKHNNGQGSAAEIIPGKVVEAQTLEVDIVAGATYSSKVILKAIEDALNQASR